MDSLRTVLDEFLPFDCKKWNYNKPNSDNIVILEIPTIALLVAILDINLSLLDAEKIFELPSVKEHIHSKRTLSINKDKCCLTIQKVPSHKKPRDATIIYMDGNIVHVPGKEFIRKNKDVRY